jgi:hypothetical protein
MSHHPLFPAMITYSFFKGRCTEEGMIDKSHDPDDVLAWLDCQQQQQEQQQQQ